MLNVRVISHMGRYRLKVDEDSYLGSKLRHNGLFAPEIDEKYRCILRQLIFDVESIEEYEVLCYQRAKIKELRKVIFQIKERITERRRERRSRRLRKRPFRSSGRYLNGLGSRDEEEYLTQLHHLANRKSNRLFELYDEVFDVEYDVIEDRLENLNEEVNELDEEEMQEEVEKSGSLVSSLMDFFR